MPSISDQIRKLLAEGKSRSEIAQQLGIPYQQVYQVDKKRHGAPVTYQSSGPRPPVRVSHHLNTPGGYGTPKGSSFRFEQQRPPDVDPETKAPRHVRTGPTQVRIAVQDGHEVILVERLGVNECRNCSELIQFSPRDGAYLHTDSVAPVTRLIALQTGPGLFD
jgi:hypothetical protein